MKWMILAMLLLASVARAEDSEGVICQPDEHTGGDPIRVIELDQSIIKVRRLGDAPDQYFASVSKGKFYKLFGERASERASMKLIAKTDKALMIERAEGGNSVTLTDVRSKQSYHCGH